MASVRWAGHAKQTSLLLDQLRTLATPVLVNNNWDSNTYPPLEFQFLFFLFQILSVGKDWDLD